MNDDIVAGVGMKNSDVVKRLRGPKRIKRSCLYSSVMAKRIYLKFNERDVIPQYSVDAHYMLDDDIGYIKISRFFCDNIQRIQSSSKVLNPIEPTN